MDWLQEFDLTQLWKLTKYSVSLPFSKILHKMLPVAHYNQKYVSEYSEKCI